MLDRALDKYTSAFTALQDHQKDNEQVFKAHERLVGNLIDAENDLRDEVAASELAQKGGELSNGSHRVTAILQTQTYADIEVIDRLIANGVIPSNLRSEIVKTIPRPPRVTIKPC